MHEDEEQSRLLLFLLFLATRTRGDTFAVKIKHRLFGLTPDVEFTLFKLCATFLQIISAYL